MRRSLLALAVLAMTLGTGCMQIHIDTDIGPDGSGTATISYQVSREVADALAKLEEAGGAGGMTGDIGETPALDDLDRERVDAAASDSGVEVEEFTRTDDASGQSLRIVVAFDHLDELSAFLNSTTASDAGEDTRDELRIARTDDGNFLLHTVSVPVPESERTDAAADTGPEGDAGDAPGGVDEMAQMQDSMQYVGVLMGAMDQLDVRMTFTVPGEVLSSNAMEVDGRTSIWAINAANMMQAQQGMEMEPEIVFSSEGLSLEPTDR